MQILHIDSSARRDDSLSRTVSGMVVDQLLERGIASQRIYRDLVAKPLPPMSAEDLVGVHGSHDPAQRESLAAHLATSAELIDELGAADTLVIGVPMYNFSVPSYLKQWIDYVCRAGVTFRYGEHGPEGLTGMTRAVIVTSSGGTTIGGAADFASTYVEHICRFLGIESVHHIDASGSKRDPDAAIDRARQDIARLADQLAA